MGASFLMMKKSYFKERNTYNSYKKKNKDILQNFFSKTEKPFLNKRSPGIG